MHATVDNATPNIMPWERNSDERTREKKDERAVKIPTVCELRVKECYRPNISDDSKVGTESYIYKLHRRLTFYIDGFKRFETFTNETLRNLIQKRPIL